jgi:curved DNA-binding protein CbpA
VRLLELLGLHATATRDEVKSRYRELARKFHPDVNGADEHADARFRAIVAAYQELLLAADGGMVPTVGAKAQVRFDGDIAHREHSPPRSSGDRFARQRTELRARLDQREKAMRRAQTDVRDGDAKAFAARERGNDQMARHFERRVEADRSRLYAFLGEIAELERELGGLEDSESPDPTARRRADVQTVHDEELAALKRRYGIDDKRR